MLGSHTAVAGRSAPYLPPRARLHCGRPRKPQHRQPEDQQRESPPQIDVDAERALIDGGAAQEPIARKERPQDDEEAADRNADVESHGAHRKMKLSTIAPASTQPPNTAGRAYHRSPAALRRGVSE